MVQNKLHYAVNRQTAAEIIYDRADCEKDFMGLTSFKGADVTLEDVRIAKNYLSEKELKKLNALVSAFFDMAEYQAENHNVMHMSDYVEQLDRTIKSVGEEVLEGAGKISHKKAMEKAEVEYRKYQVKTLSSAEKAYIETLKELKMIEGKKKQQALRKGYSMDELVSAMGNSLSKMSILFFCFLGLKELEKHTWALQSSVKPAVLLFRLKK